MAEDEGRKFLRKADEALVEFCREDRNVNRDEMPGNMLS
jgi:hypothetical protein